MKRPILICALALASPSQAQQPSTTDVFNAGKEFANTGKTVARGAVSSTSGSLNVPNYNTNAPESANYVNGTGQISSAGSQKVIDCSSSQLSDAYRQQECNAVNYLYGNPATRPRFTIDRTTDPVMQSSANTVSNPPNVMGSTSTGPACSIQTTTTPATYTTQVCNEFYTNQTNTCTKTLTVSVTSAPSCVAGSYYGNFWVVTHGDNNPLRWAGIVVNARCNPDSATIQMNFYAVSTEDSPAGNATITVDATTGAAAPQTFTGFYGRSWYGTDIFNRVHYEGGGCNGTTCNFTFSTSYYLVETQCDESGTCTTTITDSPRARGTFSFTQPHTVYSTSDSWDNQCTLLEARLP